LKLDKLDSQNQGELFAPTLVLCEGKRDASFILHLAQQRGIVGIQVGFPVPVTSRLYGKDGFKDYLINLRARSGFKNLRHIVILRDADNSGDAAFEEVTRQIAQAERYAVPGAPERESAGLPGITVRLIPDGASPGNLDVLLLKSIDSTHPLRVCFSSFFDCCGLGLLTDSKAAKIKLTTIIAASCQRNSSCSLVWVWNEPGNPIPLNSPVFDGIADFLRHFP
jgi:hypothetical protein